MIIDEMFTSTGAVNSKLMKHHEKEIIRLTPQLNGHSPKLSHRLKFLKYHDGGDIFCSCGKPLAFSSDRGVVFKYRCAGNSCIYYGIEKRKKAFRKTIEKRNDTSIKDYTIDDIKNQIMVWENSGVNPGSTGKYQTDIVKFIKKSAKESNKKYSRYLYDIKHGIDDKRCICSKSSPEFLGFYNGYHDTARCCGVGPKSREANKITDMCAEFDVMGDITVVDSPGVNIKPWTLQCNTCSLEFTKWVNNGSLPSEVKCPKCYPTSKSSYEYRVIEEIRKFYSGEIEHTKFLESTRKWNGARRSIDIFIPEFSLGIEINGLHWHSDNRDRHLDKMNICSAEGINLIQFTDVDINNNLDLVLSMIKNRMNLSDRKIYARQTEIKEISTNEYRSFADEHHIKGYTSAKIKLGMFYGDELVSVFSVSKSRFSIDEMECIRFCSLKNTNIIGGLSKFLSFISKNYEFDRMITYVDLHYGTGKSYSKVGMNLIGDTPPNYYYWKHNKLESRHKYQKHKLKDLFPDRWSPEKTESEIMDSVGFKRYYDCGNLKYEWIKG